MGKLAIFNNVSRSFGRVGLKFKKHSPELMVFGGIVGGVASAVMACKATLKVNDVLEEAKHELDAVKQVRADETISDEKYSEEDAKKDLTVIYVKTGVKLVKLYGPSVVLGAASIASILTGHNILRTRNLALAAAYTAVDTGFKEYRGRVVNRFGKEVDRELKYNIKAQKIEEPVVDENGKETVETKIVNVADPNTYSEYARFFDVGCKGWDKDPEYNLLTLRSAQSYANEKLRSQGYLFLNDVYDMLGIPRTRAGQVVGWVYDEKNPVGDNFVDFGIYDLYNEKARDFVNGYERTILLDFNVDGNVLEYI